RRPVVDARAGLLRRVVPLVGGQAHRARQTQAEAVQVAELGDELVERFRRGGAVAQGEGGVGGQLTPAPPAQLVRGRGGDAVARAERRPADRRGGRAAFGEQFGGGLHPARKETRTRASGKPLKASSVRAGEVVSDAPLKMRPGGGGPGRAAIGPSSLTA